MTDPRVGDDRVHEVSRRLRSRCEAIYGAVFATTEARRGGHGLDAVQWYMAGRSAPLGPVSAEVAGALFGTFDPRRVHAGLDGVWARVTPEQMVTWKLDSAVAVLDEVVPATAPELARALALLAPALDAAETAETAGHPVFAALAELPRPAPPVAQLWRLCDMVREHRSDAHVSAWRSPGFDPVEINVLNELWRGEPTGSITCTLMGWDPAAVDAALARLAERGLASDGAITPAGRQIREDVERATGAQQASVVRALGEDAAELFGLLDPWAHAIADRF